MEGISVILEAMSLQTAALTLIVTALDRKSVV